MKSNISTASMTNAIEVVHICTGWCEPGSECREILKKAEEIMEIWRNKLIGYQYKAQEDKARIRNKKWKEMR